MDNLEFVEVTIPLWIFVGIYSPTKSVAILKYIIRKFPSNLFSGVNRVQIFTIVIIYAALLSDDNTQISVH